MKRKTKKYKTLYKVFKKDLKSNNGDVKWEINKWNKVKGQISICENGFHASKRIVDAMQYTNAEEIVLVEVKGESEIQRDKECWECMRIKKVFIWTKEMSVKLAIYAAELCIDNYEKEYPNDDRPRKAIQAAKNHLEGKITESAVQSAARSAAWSAVRSADSARSAAWSAAWSAESAWLAARSAVRSAESARSAAWSAAWSAVLSAWSAARSAELAAASAWSAENALNKYESYIKQLLNIQEEI